MAELPLPATALQAAHDAATSAAAQVTALTGEVLHQAAAAAAEIASHAEFAAATVAAELASHLPAAVHDAAAHAAQGAHDAGAHITEPYLMLRPFFNDVLHHHHLPHEMIPAFYGFLITALVALAGWLGTRAIERIPGPLQNFLEWAYERLEEFVVGMMGERGREWIFFIGACFTYIFLCNLIGLVPQAESPTANLNQTVALALFAFFFTQYAGFRSQGLHYAKHFFGEPLWLAPIFFVIHVIGEIARPLSLAMRLFGNLRGEDITLCILFFLAPFVVPLPMVFFMAFTGLIQAMVFSMLTMSYIAGALPPEDGSGHH